MKKYFKLIALICASLGVVFYGAALAGDAGDPPRGGVQAKRWDGGEPSDEARSLTDEQTVAVKSILSRYDASSLTAADAKAIHKAFRDAGIPGGAGERNAIVAAGFDPRKLRDPDPPPDMPGSDGSRQRRNSDRAASADDAGDSSRRGVQAQRWDGGYPSDETRTLTDEQSAMVTSILSRYDASSLTAADAKAIHKAFRDAGIPKGPGERNALVAAGFDPGKLRMLDPPPDGPGSDGSRQRRKSADASKQRQQPGAQENRPNRGEEHHEARSLTDEQTARVKSILSEYDASSLTAADARAIHNAFRDAGIRKGPGMRNAVVAAGFDPDTLRDLDPPPEKK